MKTLIHKVILKILKTLRSPFPLLDIKFMIMQQRFVFKLSVLVTWQNKIIRFTYLLLNSHWFLIECHDIPRPIFKANNKHSFVFLESLSILQYIFVLQAIHAPLFILYLSRLSLSLSPLSSFESYFLHSKHNNASSFRTFSTPIHRRDSMKTEWARSYRCFHYTF